MPAVTTMTLGGVDLMGGLDRGNHLIWQDMHSFSPVAQNYRRTLGGNGVIFVQSLTRGRPITLVSKTDQGWITHSKVDEIKTLADVAGATYSLVIDPHHGGAFTVDVAFRHHESPAFSARPLLECLNPGDDEYYLVTLKLITV